MIWFSAESAPICTSPSACGPIAMRVTRNTATSGILIFCASRLASVPIARMSPQDSSVCFAISMEADASNALPLRKIGRRSIQRFQPGADFAGRDIGLIEQLAHGEEAVELARKMAGGHGHAGFFEEIGR